MPETTQEIIERVGLIPVLRATTPRKRHAVVEAMIAGGVTVVEVTMTVPGAVDLLKELKQEYGAKLLLGSGTVTTAEQAEATIEAGAEFVVSPSSASGSCDRNARPEQENLISRRAHAHRSHHGLACGRGLREDLSLLGSGRRELSEIAARAFPDLKLIPTGGVTLQTAESFLTAGARALGVGSDLVNLAAIDAGHRRRSRKRRAPI